MSLIKCFDCGRKVSDKATVCVHCGCPLAALRDSGTVLIITPDNIADEWGGMYTAFITVCDKEGKKLWKGGQCEIAEFVIKDTADIMIDFDGNARTVYATVEKNKKYAIVKDRYYPRADRFILREIGIPVTE